MEMILNTIHQTRDGSAVLKLWEGFQRVWFSLEIASFGGMIHFYIYTQKGFKSLVEHQIYAQYPGIEIEEVEDYTKIFSLTMMLINFTPPNLRWKKRTLIRLKLILITV